jgi:hypothetical protein
LKKNGFFAFYQNVIARYEAISLGQLYTLQKDLLKEIASYLAMTRGGLRYGSYRVMLAVAARPGPSKRIPKGAHQGLQSCAGTSSRNPVAV